MRQLLAAEGNERLGQMEGALLRLEADPTAADAIDEIFRHAHSLKGAARMAELEELATLAHDLEARLADVRAARRLGKGDASIVLRAIDEMRALLGSATGEAASERADVSTAINAPTAPVDEGLRVDTAALDHILDLVGELSIVRHRFERRAEDAAALARAARAADPETATALRRLADDAEEDHARLARTCARLDEAVQRVRLTPLDAAIVPLRRVVRDVAEASGKSATFEFVGSGTRLDKRILDGVKDTLMHLVRNAVDHGLEAPADRKAKGKPAAGTVRIRAYTDGSDAVLEVEDDGRGFDVEAVRAAAIRKGLATESELADASDERILDHVFLPGFSTAAKVTGISGRGVGLDVVRDAARRLRGSYALVNRPGHGSTIRLRFPAARSATRALVIRVAGRPYALPIESVERVERVAELAPGHLAGLKPAPLARVLGFPATAAPDILLTLVSGSLRAHVLVDGVQNEEDVIVKPHTSLLGRVPTVRGAAILDGGNVCIVLDADDVVRAAGASPPRPRVLVAEDSPSIRARLRAVLTRAGFAPTIAEDGMEALALAATGDFAAIVSDVEMPRVDGLELVRRLREDPRYGDTPVVLFSSLGSDEHRARGWAAGADGYVVKGPGAERALLEDLIPRVKARMAKAR